MRALLEGFLETGQQMKNFGGVEMNSRERPDLTVSRTEASKVMPSHRSAKRARRPPMGRLDVQLLGATRGVTPGTTNEPSILSNSVGSVREWPLP